MVHLRRHILTYGMGMKQCVHRGNGVVHSVYGEKKGVVNVSSQINQWATKLIQRLIYKEKITCLKVII